MPIVLYSNQNHAQAKETEVCPTLPAAMGMGGGGYIPMIVVQRRFSDVRVYETETSTTLESGTGEGGNNLPMILDTLVFDEAQITCPSNGLHPKWGGGAMPRTHRRSRTDGSNYQKE